MDGWINRSPDSGTFPLLRVWTVMTGQLLSDHLDTNTDRRAGPCGDQVQGRGTAETDTNPPICLQVTFGKWANGFLARQHVGELR